MPYEAQRHRAFRYGVWGRAWPLRKILLYILVSKQLIPLHHHTFNGPLSGITRVSRYQKGKTNLDFNVARDSEWQWHQLGHMQVCTSLQTDNHASTPPLIFFTGRMLFLPPNQQRQSTEGTTTLLRVNSCRSPLVLQQGRLC